MNVAAAIRTAVRSGIEGVGNAMGAIAASFENIAGIAGGGQMRGLRRGIIQGARQESAAAAMFAAAEPLCGVCRHAKKQHRARTARCCPCSLEFLANGGRTRRTQKIEAICPDCRHDLLMHAQDTVGIAAAMAAISTRCGCGCARRESDGGFIAEPKRRGKNEAAIREFRWFRAGASREESAHFAACGIDWNDDAARDLRSAFPACRRMTRLAGIAEEFAPGAGGWALLDEFALQDAAQEPCSCGRCGNFAQDASRAPLVEIDGWRYRSKWPTHAACAAGMRKRRKGTPC